MRVEQRLERKCVDAATKAGWLSYKKVFMRVEQRLERKCVDAATKAGWLSYKLDQRGGPRGWPDRAFWGYGGRYLIVEFKAPDWKEPTGEDLQAEMRSEFEDRGFEVHIIQDYASFVDLFNLE